MQRASLGDGRKRCLRPGDGSAPSRQGHEIDAPEPTGLDLFDPVAVARTVDSSAAIPHLATRIPPRERPGDRRPGERTTACEPRPPRLLVDAALVAETEAYLQPSITFLSPPEGVVDEETPLGPVPGNLRSALVAEEETARFEPASERSSA